MEEEIDLMDMVKYFWSKKIKIILVGIICVILAIVYTFVLVTPKYSAFSSLILTNYDNLETEADMYLYAKLPDRYYAIVNSRAVLDKVISNLKLEGIDDVELFKEENIEIKGFPTNFFIKVTVTTDDAKKSADIANEIIKVSIEEIKKIYNDENVQFLDVAQENWNPVNVGIVSNVLKFVLVGEILFCGYLGIIYLFVDGNKKDIVKKS